MVSINYNFYEIDTEDKAEETIQIHPSKIKFLSMLEKPMADSTVVIKSQEKLATNLDSLQNEKNTLTEPTETADSTKNLSIRNFDSELEDNSIQCARIISENITDKKVIDCESDDKSIQHAKIMQVKKIDKNILTESTEMADSERTLSISNINTESDKKSIQSAKIMSEKKSRIYVANKNGSNFSKEKNNQNESTLPLINRYEINFEMKNIPFEIIDEPAKEIDSQTQSVEQETSSNVGWSFQKKLPTHIDFEKLSDAESNIPHRVFDKNLSQATQFFEQERTEVKESLDQKEPQVDDKFAESTMPHRVFNKNLSQATQLFEQERTEVQESLNQKEPQVDDKFAEPDTEKPCGDEKSELENQESQKSDFQDSQNAEGQDKYCGDDFKDSLAENSNLNVS